MNGHEAEDNMRGRFYQGLRKFLKVYLIYLFETGIPYEQILKAFRKAEEVVYLKDTETPKAAHVDSSRLSKQLASLGSEVRKAWKNNKEENQIKISPSIQDKERESSSPQVANKAKATSATTVTGMVCILLHLVTGLCLVKGFLIKTHQLNVTAFKILFCIALTFIQQHCFKMP